SGEASGLPSASLAMPSSAVINGAWSRVITELVSAIAPPRRMIAVRSSPVLLSVAENPAPIASIATSTPTTPAMPMMMTPDAPQRCGRLETPTLATARVCWPRRVSSSQPPSNATPASTPHQGSMIQAASPIASTSTMPRLPAHFLILFIVASSAAGQCIDDLQALGAQCRQQSHDHAQHHDQQQCHQPGLGRDRLA